jgi:DNA-binding SARP family transcriptional activator
LRELGSLGGPLNARLIEYLYLAGRTEEVRALGEAFRNEVHDQRFRGEMAPAMAIVAHGQECVGQCASAVDILDEVEAEGATYVAVAGRVKLAPLLLEHGGMANAKRAWGAVREARDQGYLRLLRYWTRLLGPHVTTCLRLSDGIALVEALARDDADGWRQPLIHLLRRANRDQRRPLLELIQRHGNRETLEALQPLQGADIAEARRQMKYAQAVRLYLRTLGGVALHRGSWGGPIIAIDKRRVRSLVGVLAAHAHTTLSRDAAIDLLWPESDGDASVNSLNQTVFQLRRFLDPGYRAGESPEYIISNSEHVGLDGTLIRSDVDEIQKLPERLAIPSREQRASTALRAIELVRGEFLADLRYEPWIGSLQLRVHTQVRSVLLPIALGAPDRYDFDVSARAAAALLELDPYDEAALLALAENLAGSGRRFAAKTLLIDYVERLRTEMDEEPSPGLQEVAASLGARLKEQT